MNEKRKQGILLFFPILVLISGMIFMAVWSYHMHQQTAYGHISALCDIVLENSPEAEPELLSALKDYRTLTEEEMEGNNYLEKYGYRAEGFCKGMSRHAFLLFIVSLAIVSSFVFGVWKYRRQNRKRIIDLTEYLEQVNTGAGGTLIQTQEDDFSQLQDEIYKTVTMLYQTREAAVAAKQNFAENLENIAHQLKTPITAAFLSIQLIVHSLGIGDKLDALPDQLSGGQQQRAAIARSLIYRPALLLADEPTGNLDRKNGKEILDLLKLSNRNMDQTILLITHDEKIALKADRIITIEDGKIIGDYPTASAERHKDIFKENGR